MPYDRSIVLSVAGFDPCGGAGVLADVKTMEQHHCIGMAVNTAITYQVEDKFFSVDWLSVDSICMQVNQLMNHYEINVVKIGIVKDLLMLEKIISEIKNNNANAKIIWDPVITVSAGSVLGDFSNKEQLKNLLQKIYLITPNIPEACKLTQMNESNEAASFLSRFCNVLLKGGHSEASRGIDVLYNDGKKLKISSVSSDEKFAKHGSGCILSSAIASELANGNSIELSCRKAKNYIDKILSSNKNLLAHHVA